MGDFKNLDLSLKEGYPLTKADQRCMAAEAEEDFTRVIDLDKETKPLSSITYPMERYVTIETCKVCGNIVVDGYCGICANLPF